MGSKATSMPSAAAAATAALPGFADEGEGAAAAAAVSRAGLKFLPRAIVRRRERLAAAG